MSARDLDEYLVVEIKRQQVINVTKKDQLFTIETDDEKVYQSKKVFLATGLKEKLLDIYRISHFYGTSIFN
ncbi:hypothetical protein CSV63_15645 [Sporosarcina sp. P34]|nr:hypothetical protein CSV63_15645 [Sporosarcina sp. P34]